MGGRDGPVCCVAAKGVRSVDHGGSGRRRWPPAHQKSRRPLTFRLQPGLSLSCSSLENETVSSSFLQRVRACVCIDFSLGELGIQGKRKTRQESIN